MAYLDSLETNSIAPHSFRHGRYSQESMAYLEIIAARWSIQTIQTLTGAGAGIASSIVACP